MALIDLHMLTDGDENRQAPLLTSTGFSLSTGICSLHE